MVVSGTNEERNIAYVYKSEASDTDLQIEARIPATWTGHLESFTSFGVGITEGTADTDYATHCYWPNIGTVTFKSDAGGAGELKQTGASGQFLPRYVKIEYDDSATTISCFGSNDAVTWSLVGTAVTKSLTFPVLTYLFGSSHDPNQTTTATPTGIAFTLTLDTTPPPEPPPPPTGNDHLIATGTSSFDCNANSVEPGDTVTLDGTARGAISFSNCIGDSTSDIIIRNDVTETGPLVISATGNSHQFTCDDCKFVTVDGTGKWSGAPAGSCGVTVSGNVWTLGKTQCGIQVRHVSGTPRYVRFIGLSSDFTVKGVEVDSTGQSQSGPGIGIGLNDHNVKLSNNPGVFRENILYTQNYVHNTPHSCFYVGPNWFQGDLRLRNIEFSFNVMESCGRNGIVFKSAVEGNNKLHHNHIKTVGFNKTGSGSHISLLDAFGDVYNNFMLDTAGSHSLKYVTQSALDLGSDFNISVYNNVLIDGAKRGIHINGNGANDYIPTIYNNTIVTTADSCIKTTTSVDAGGSIRDNLCAATSGIDISSGTIENLKNITGSIASHKFVNAAGDDYHLTATSPARNAGTAGAPATDHEDRARPIEGTDDVGAYEFVP